MDPIDHISPAEALARLKQLIHTGKYGINYLFEPTEKNYSFLQTFFIDEQRQLEILLSLDENDYQKDEYSNDPNHPDNYLYVFIKKGVSLLPRYAKVFEYSVVDIYIKFFFCNEKQSCVVILSFHKTGDY